MSFTPIEVPMTVSASTEAVQTNLRSGVPYVANGITDPVTKSAGDVLQYNGSAWVASDELTDLKSDLSGWSDDTKQALLQLAAKVAYIDDDGQDYYDALQNALYPVELLSIEAVYTQSGTVYDADSLDSLKDDLVVTAHWLNSSDTIVPSGGYTLSGTLESGTSTITVTYQDKTTTFDVTVTATIYSLFNHTFSGSDAINTEIKLLESDRTFSMVFDVDFNNNATLGNWRLFNVMNGTSPWAGLNLQQYSTNTPNRAQITWMTDTTVNNIPIMQNYVGKFKLVLTHSIGNVLNYWYKIGTNNTVSGTITSTFQSVTSPLAIGGTSSGSIGFKGTVNECVVYPDVISSDRINAFIG